jgi:hypothetical protein
VPRTLSYPMLLLTTLLAGCVAGPAGPPPVPLGPGLEWVAFLLVAIAGVLWLTRNGVSKLWHRGLDNGSSHAWDLLRERYAKGEISREEYLRVAADLEVNEHAHGR